MISGVNKIHVPLSFLNVTHTMRQEDLMTNAANSTYTVDWRPFMRLVIRAKRAKDVGVTDPTFERSR